MEPGKCSKHRGLRNLSRNNEDIADYQDNWSRDYDDTLAEWRYDAPKQVASMLMAGLSPKQVILDAGCGTGLGGRALRSAGFETVDGIDISQQSLKIAELSGAYSTLQLMDIQHCPSPIKDDQYDGLACVGVLTYVTDSTGAGAFQCIVTAGQTFFSRLQKTSTSPWQ